MRRLIGLCCVCVCLVLAGPAAAGQIVQFRDGRYASILAHEIDGSWVRLDYRNGYVILPVGRISTIAKRHVETVLYRAPTEAFERLARRVMAVESAPPAAERVAAVTWRPAHHWRTLPPLGPG